MGAIHKASIRKEEEREWEGIEKRMGGRAREGKANNSMRRRYVLWASFWESFRKSICQFWEDLQCKFLSETFNMFIAF